MDRLTPYYEMINELLSIWAPKALMALITLIVGWIVINIFSSWLKRLLGVRHIDETLVPFLVSLSKNLLRILLLISVASMLGIATTSFVAVVGAAGLAVGLALQGSLSNFAGGVLLLVLRPFKVGDVIEAQGFTAKVKAIHIFSTHLVTADNKEIILPNGPLANGPIVNFSSFETRRVDMLFGISYSDNIKKAKEIILSCAKDDERILKDPEPVVIVSQLADSSVNLSARLWVKKDDYWDVYFEYQEMIKSKFDENQISIPFPQMDVSVTQAALNN
jgi:small conductance mechanosensitive channel